MKEIEEGCRAVIVNSGAGNNGLKVIVGKFIGDKIGWINRRRHWEIDKNIGTTHGDIVNHISEYQLRRLDDEQTTTWEHVAETCKFIPNKETA